MSGTDKKRRIALCRLTDALVEDVLDTSDQETLAEFAESGGDPAKNAAEMRSHFESAVVATKKRRLKAAQAGVAASRSNTSLAPTIDIADARQRLHRILASSTGGERLTLAARKESELSDADVLGMLEDMEALGALPPDDDEGGQ